MSFRFFVLSFSFCENLCEKNKPQEATESFAFPDKTEMTQLVNILVRLKKFNFQLNVEEFFLRTLAVIMQKRSKCSLQRSCELRVPKKGRCEQKWRQAATKCI